MPTPNIVMPIGTASQTVTGTAANDIVFGGPGDDTLLGLAGPDTLEGRGGADFLNGGDDLDTARYLLSPSGVSVSLLTNVGQFGDAAGDQLVSIEHLDGSRFDDTLTGDGGENRLMGYEGDDALFGGAGRDRLFGHLGADVLNGGDGYDRAYYNKASSAIAVNLFLGVGTVGEAAGDTLIEIEGVVGSEFDDTITGSNDDNRLVGGNGDDQLTGLGGDDTLVGGLGADVLDGGAGHDRAYYTKAASGVAVSLVLGLGTAGEAAGDTLSNVESIVGSGYDDTLAGDSGENHLKGERGDDHLTGRGGDDTLIGGAGGDTLDGGNGFDTANYAASDQIIINVRIANNTGGDALGDTLISIEELIGSAFGDSIIMGDLDNRIYAGGGDDFVDSGNGNDTLFGGEGADFLHGGEGIDWARYTTSPSGVTIGMLSSGSGGDAQGDTLSWIENIGGSKFNDVLTGNRLTNVLRGLAGDDALNGDRGDDKLFGDEGRDTLTGGDGADRFSLKSHDLFDTTIIAEGDAIALPLANPSDVITDFEAGSDTLALDRALFSARTLSAGSEPTALGLSEGGSTFTLADDVLYHVTEMAPSGGDRQFEVVTVVELSVTGAFDISDISFV